MASGITGFDDGAAMCEDQLAFHIIVTLVSMNMTQLEIRKMSLKVQILIYLSKQDGSMNLTKWIG